MSVIFYTIAHGKSANNAFDQAVNDARNVHKIDVGVSGSIAEKEEFITFEGSVSYDPVNAIERAEKIMASNNVLLNDAYGPAGCINIGENEYLFFGTAFSNIEE